MFEYIEPVAYGVSDMDEALRVFRDNLGLELSDRRIIEGSTTVEKVVFRCGPKLIELLRPINHPAHVLFLKEYGPGLHHLGFTLNNLPKQVNQLRQKGVVINGLFMAGAVWTIACYDYEKSDLDLLKRGCHGDSLAEAE